MMGCYKAPLIILAAILLVSCQAKEELIAANQKQAEPIIEAIYSFQADNAAFPKSLDDLVPTYIEELPFTTSKDDFFYSTDWLNGFILAFTVSESQNFGCGYTANYQIWDCGYGD